MSLNLSANSKLVVSLTNASPAKSCVSDSSQALRFDIERMIQLHSSLFWFSKLVCDEGLQSVSLEILFV